MKETSCPNCGAGFEPRTRGPLKDKVLHCPYCGHTIDVPDEYEVSREEVFHDGPGSIRKVKVTERRSDVPTMDIPLSAAFRGGSFDPKAFFDKLKAEGKIPADAEFVPDENGNFVYETTSEDIFTHTQDAMGNTIENIQEVMGEDFDPFGGKLSKLSAQNPGKVFSRTEQRHHAKSFPSQVKMTDYSDDSPDTTAIIRWLVVLAVVVLLIVLAIKLL